VARHFVAVSTNAAKVSEFRHDRHTVRLWGLGWRRYSMDSAIGLSTMLAIGPDNFRACSTAFNQMDEHFRTARSRKTCGADGPWCVVRRLLGAQTVAVLPYDST